MNKLIYLTQGKISIVSECRYMHVLNMIPWFAKKDHNGKRFYVYRHIWINGKRTTISMHQVIWKHMGNIVPSGYVIDHIDRDGLNNQDDNLRILTHSESNYNQDLRYDNTLGIRGIDFNKQYNKYRVQIGENNKRVTKHFDTLKEAIDCRLQWEENNLLK